MELTIAGNCAILWVQSIDKFHERRRFYDEHLYRSDVIQIACGRLNTRPMWFLDAHPIPGVFFVCLKHLW